MIVKISSRMVGKELVGKTYRAYGLPFADLR